MKFLKLFVASSITEFHALRYDLGNYIRTLNDDLVEQEKYIELVICEDLSNAVHTTRKQDEYNNEILKSQMFLILCGSRMGQYTMEEFDVACKARDDAGAPLIHACRMMLPGIAEPDASAQRFLECAAERGIAVQEYDSANALKHALYEQLSAMF